MTVQIISRADAKAQGLKWYFSGKPCIHGHLEVKLVSSGRCKVCSALHAKDWVERNKGRVNDYLKDWRANNGDLIKRLNKDWQSRNRQSQIEKRRSQAEVLRKKVADWQKKNPDKCSLYARNRRALKKTSGTHTLAEIEALLKKQNFKCASCFIQIKNVGKNGRHADHIVAISTGGTNDISNIQMLCQPCNSRKYNKDPFEWANENGRLL